MRANLWKVLPYLVICPGLARGKVATERVVLQSFDGRSVPAELGRISVPADRRHPGRQVSISFYHLRAKNPGSTVPVAFLMGGPGVAATFIAKVPPYFDLFSFLSERSPVILLDQRGTGQSTPKVDCPAGFEPPLNLFTTPRLLQKTYADAYSACARYWAALGAFPDDYSVEEVADDIEDLRIALQVPQVDLLGFSFGTRIGLEMIRRHPKSVRRAVLQGTVTPDGLVRLPLGMDVFFRRTAVDVKPQAAGKGLDADLESAYRSALQRLKRKPLFVPITTSKGSGLTVRIGPAVFAAMVATRTTDTRLPALLTSVSRNDTSVIAPMLQSIYRDLEGGAGNMMAHSLACSGTDPQNRLRLAGEQISNSLLPEPFDNLVVTDEFCGDIHSNRRSKGEPAPSGNMPVLFITGDLDDRTPIELAESALRGFPRGRSVIVRNGGHELLVDDQVRKLVAAFFQGDDIAHTEIYFPPRTFLSVAEAAQLPRQPM